MSLVRIESTFKVISANSNASIGVVLVNWNGWRNTLRSYEFLLASDYKNWTLFIVDNASTDGSAEFIRQQIPDAVLIESQVNLGFAGGCNLAIEEIIRRRLDYVFLLNSDATVSTDSLTRLLSASEDLQDRAVLGSVVRYWPSGEIQYFGSRRSKRSGRPDWFTMRDDAGLLKSKLIVTDFVFGAALFAPTKLFQRVGLFDERFFLNFEEIDWCYRAAAKGIPQFVVTDSVIQHQGSASLGQKEAPLQTYFLYRNRLLFFDKHCGLRHHFRGYLDVAHELRASIARSVAASSLLRAPADPSLRALLMAIRDYIFRRFGDCPRKVRELAQRTGKVPDATKGGSTRWA